MGLLPKVEGSLHEVHARSLEQWESLEDRGAVKPDMKSLALFAKANNKTVVQCRRDDLTFRGRQWNK